MIKLLGVITEGGLNVKTKFFGKEKQKKLIPSLISAIKGISETLGQTEVKKLDFGDEKLILTRSEKGYTVTALTDRAEAYINKLIQIIAKDIDENEEIPPSSNIVRERVGETIEDIMGTYVRDTVRINFFDSIVNMWNLIFEEIKADDTILKRFNAVDRRVDRSKSPSYQWKQFSSKIEVNFDHAVNYALNGNFDHACAASLGVEDPMRKIFSIRMGLLSLDTIGMKAPPLTLLEQQLDKIPQENAYTAILKLDIKSKKKKITPTEYLRILKAAIKQFEEDNGQEHRVKPFLFLGESFGYFPKFSQKLAEFFNDKSECLSNYINARIDRGKMVQKAHSISEREEVRHEINEWTRKIENITDELDTILNPTLLTRLCRLLRDRTNLNTVSLKYLSELQAYLRFLLTLTQSPILNLAEHKEKFEEIVTHYQYFRKTIKKGIPIHHVSLLDAFSMVSSSLRSLYHLSTSKERNNILKKSHSLLKHILDITIKEIVRIRPTIRMLVNVSSNLSELFTMADVKKEEEILLVYLLLENIDLEKIEDWKRSYPPNFIAISLNLFFSLAPIADKFLTGRKRKKILKKCTDSVVKLMKWFLYQGKVSKATLTSLCFYISKIIDVYSPSELEELAKTIIGFSKIAIPDWQEKDYYLAEESSVLIDFFLKVGDQLENDDFFAIAEQVYGISLNAWVRNGFQAKARELEKEYSQVFKH